MTLINKNGLKIELQMKNTEDKVCQMRALFSNVSTAPMEKLMLRLAAPKVINNTCHIKYSSFYLW